MAEVEKTGVSPEGQKSDIWAIWRAYASVRSVRDRIGAFWGRSGRGTDTPEREGPERRQYGWGVWNTMRAVALAVAGLAGGAGASEVSLPISQMASKTLHTLWYDGLTVYDQYSLLSEENPQLKTQNALLKAQKEASEQEVKTLNVQKGKLAEDKIGLQKEKAKLSWENRNLAAQVAKLKVSQKSKAKPTHKEKSKSRTQKMKSWKERAIENQKVISAKLEELLRWQGKAGKLKSYGVREWVFDSEAKTKTYVLKEQPRSLRIIKRKIAEKQKMAQLEAHPVKSTTQKTHVKTKAGAKNKATVPSRNASKPKKRGDVVRKGIVRQSSVIPVQPKSSPISKQQAEHGSADLSKVFVVPSTTSSLPHQVEWILSKNSGLKPVSDPLDNAQLDNARIGTPLIPEKSPVVSKANSTASTSGVPIEDMHRLPKGVSGVIAGSQAKNVADRSGKTPSVDAKKSESKTVKRSQAAPASHIEKGSGLTPRTLTDEKLQKFLDGVNTKLGKLDKKDPLHGSKATVKKVTVDGMTAHRIILKRGDTQLGTFTLKSEEAGKKKKSDTGAHIHDYKQNYQIIASKPNFINWAHRTEEKYEKNAEKKKLDLQTNKKK